MRDPSASWMASRVNFLAWNWGLNDSEDYITYWNWLSYLSDFSFPDVWSFYFSVACDYFLKRWVVWLGTIFSSLIDCYCCLHRFLFGRITARNVLCLWNLRTKLFEEFFSMFFGSYLHIFVLVRFWCLVKLLIFEMFLHHSPHHLSRYLSLLQTREKIVNFRTICDVAGSYPSKHTVLFLHMTFERAQMLICLIAHAAKFHCNKGFVVRFESMPISHVYTASLFRRPRLYTIWTTIWLWGNWLALVWVFVIKLMMILT